MLADKRLRVLHVTESLGSGVEAAILDYVRSSPEIEHSLLFSSRGYHTGQLGGSGLHQVVSAGRGALSLARRLGHSLRDIDPDVVHLHSSWAGVVGRIRIGVGSRAVVYSPHAFFFDRTNLSRASAAAAHTVERVLAGRTDVIAAVSPYERESALKMGVDSVYVPNVAHIASSDNAAYERPIVAVGLPKIVAVGRLSVQKDPDFFLAVKKLVDAEQIQAKWEWIGGGDDSFDRRLTANNVEVSGWVDRSEALRRITEASLYVHTAAWEGSPISLLEVEQLGVPAVVRSIPSVVSLGYPEGLVNPAAVAKRIVEAITNPSDAPVRVPAFNPDRLQRTALLEAYKLAMDRCRLRRSARFSGGN